MPAVYLGQGGQISNRPNTGQGSRVTIYNILVPRGTATWLRDCRSSYSYSLWHHSDISAGPLWPGVCRVWGHVHLLRRVVAGCSKRSSSKAAASEEVRRTLRYVETSERSENDAGGLFQDPASIRVASRRCEPSSMRLYRGRSQTPLRYLEMWFSFPGAGDRDAMGCCEAWIVESDCQATEFVGWGV